MSDNNSMASALGIALEQREQEEEAARQAALPPVVLTPAQEAEADLAHARGLIYDTLTKTKNASDQMAEIARESMEPRAFDALSNMLKTQADVAEKMLKLHADHQRVQNNAISLAHSAALVPGDKNDFTGDEVITLFRKKK